MRLYLAGPMTGRPRFGFDAFREWRERLRSLGHEVLCPAERDESDGFAPDEHGVRLAGWDARAAWRWIVDALATVDGVAVLDGWESSQGATIEVQLARIFGLNIYRASDFRSAEPPEPMRFGGDARFLRILRELSWLHCRKGADYGVEGDSFFNVRGSAAWGIPPWVGAMVRASDKVVRLQALARGSALQNEGAVDSFNDLASYAVIARVLFEEECGGGEGSQG